MLCGKGPGRYRIHNAVAAELRGIAREAGAQVSMEEVCPELLQGKPGDPDAVEARLDLNIWLEGPGGPKELWVDVAHIHPAGTKVRGAAAKEDRAAAKSAERRKRDRYGDGTGGTFVYPFVVEAFGGLGHGALTVLDSCLISLAARQWLGPRALSTVKKRWCACLGAALFRAQASIFREAYRRSQDGEDADREISSEEEDET